MCVVEGMVVGVAVGVVVAMFCHSRVCGYVVLVTELVLSGKHEGLLQGLSWYLALGHCPGSVVLLCGLLSGSVLLCGSVLVGGIGSLLVTCGPVQASARDWRQSQECCTKGLQSDLEASLPYTKLH